VIPYGADYDDEGNRVDAVDAYDQAHGDLDVPLPDRPVSDSSARVSETKTSPDQRKRSQTYTSYTSDTVCDDELLAGARNGTWLDEQKFPDLQYAIAGLIPEGFTLEVGPPKAGKSWLTLNLLLALASGGRALGHIEIPQARRVLYLALEDGDRRMQDRCRALLGDNEKIPELFNYQTRVMPGKLLLTISAWMRRYPDTALVVVDTLGKVMPPALQGESAYQRDYRVGTALKDIADASTGLAIIVLHHDRKANAEDFVDAVSGTHGLAGAADTVMVLCRKRQSNEGSLKITGRDVPEDEYALKILNGKTWQLDGKSLAAAAAAAREREDTGALGDRSTEILNAVLRHPQGVRAAALAEKFGSNVYTYLNRLADAGRIVKAGRGLYTPPPEVPPISQSVSEVSEVSDSQVSSMEDDDTETHSMSEVSETADGGPVLLAARDPSVPDPLPRCGHPACVDALAGECLAGRGLCLVCGGSLNPKLAAAGEMTHPTCPAEAA
jgi:RecA-family ATPase